VQSLRRALFSRARIKVKPVAVLQGDAGDALRDDYLFALQSLARRCVAEITAIKVDGDDALLVTDDAVASQLLNSVSQCGPMPCIVAPCVAMLRGRYPLLALDKEEVWAPAREAFDDFVAHPSHEAMEAAVREQVALLRPGTLDAMQFARRVAVSALVAALGCVRLAPGDLEGAIASVEFFLSELPARAYSDDAALREDYLSPTPANVELAKHADALAAALQRASCNVSLLAEAVLSSFLPLTTSVCMSLHLLAVNAAAQTALRADAKGGVDAAVVWESLRLCPPFPLLAREPRDALQLGGFVVPARSRLWVPLWWLGKSARIWGVDVDDFRPARWTAGAQLPPGGNMAFGQGRRACPGVAVATDIHAATLRALVRCFEIRSKSKGAAKLPCAFTGVRSCALGRDCLL